MTSKTSPPPIGNENPPETPNRDGVGLGTPSPTIDTISERVIQILLPVTVCAIYCCFLIRILSKNLTPTEPNLLDFTWQQLGIKVTSDVGADTSSATTLASYLVIVAVFITMIVATTLIILFIFYMQWQQCLIYYFYLPSAIILIILTPAFFRATLETVNLFAIDLLTIIFMTWNFAALGMMSIFGLYAPGPLCLQRFYLIHNSVILSVLMIHALPGWASWLLLTFLVLWDLFAVLAPYGPLNLILDFAQREGIVEMPGLIYSSDTKQTTQQNKSNQKDEQVEDERGRVSPEVIGELAEESVMMEKGVSIGLGDFIFYSLLTGLASKGRERSDFYTVLTTLDAILFGLILTIFSVALSKRALPALPASIGLGLTVAALTIQFVPPLSNTLADRAIFV